MSNCSVSPQECLRRDAIERINTPIKRTLPVTYLRATDETATIFMRALLDGSAISTVITDGTPKVIFRQGSEYYAIAAGEFVSLAERLEIIEGYRYLRAAHDPEIVDQIRRREFELNPETPFAFNHKTKVMLYWSDWLSLIVLSPRAEPSAR